jgi:mono/diheme cytochrome c family protein
MLRSLVIISFFALTLRGQTVLDGVYTTAQADRGEAAYQMNCAGCHGEDLYGRAMGALRGDKFLDRWREDSLNMLFTHIKTRMPDRAPGSLSEAMYLDILSYVLRVNGFPAGKAELTPSVVEKSLLVGKDGPRPLPTNAQVQLIGCFSSGMLFQATEPVRTRDPQHSTAEELQRSAAQPLGTQSFRLQNLDDLAGFTIAAYEKHKVQVKGVLIRGGAGNDRINVLSLESLSSGCSE